MPSELAGRKRCRACKDTGVLDRRVIDGTAGYITCGFCGRKPERKTK